jgi:hypothetical protein
VFAFSYGVPRSLTLGVVHLTQFWWERCSPGIQDDS